MFVRQSSDGRLYIKTSVAGRRLKLLRDVFEETRLNLKCYMFMSKNKGIKAA